LQEWYSAIEKKKMQCSNHYQGEFHEIEKIAKINNELFEKIKDTREPQQFMSMDTSSPENTR
jgi:hypothetical protein